jgi:hypothetical protein
MKKILVYVLIGIAISSCKKALFDSLPGQEQKTFSKQLQGSYFVKTPSSFFKRSTLKDTLFFDITETEFISRDSGNMNKTKLDETHCLRMVNQKYTVIALQDDDFLKYWSLSFIEPTKKGLNIYYVLEDEKNPILPKYFSRSFVAVNNSGDSVFAYKTNDIQLGNYFEKVLRKKDALVLMRIQK